MSTLVESTIADDAQELVERLAEIQAVAHVVERTLYHAEADAQHDLVRLAVRGVQRLADLAGAAAMALGERIEPAAVLS